jgi:hypothetical protein
MSSTHPHAHDHNHRQHCSQNLPHRLMEAVGRHQKIEPHWRRKVAQFHVCEEDDAQADGIDPVCGAERNQPAFARGTGLFPIPQSSPHFLGAVSDLRVYQACGLLPSCP